MFGIGLPELIVIFIVALLVVGPDKLPGLARSLAKGMTEMKKAVNELKTSLNEEDSPLNSVNKELEQTAAELRETMNNSDPSHWHPASGHGKMPTEDEVIEMESRGETVIPAEETEDVAAQAPGEADSTPAESATASSEAAAATAEKEQAPVQATVTPETEVTAAEPAPQATGEQNASAPSEKEKPQAS